jgi:hypothetical protein
MLVFAGPPSVRVAWTLSGSGSLNALSETTDISGMAMAIYTPGVEGSKPKITVTHGT